MSEVTMAEISMQRHLLDLPDEIVFEIFRGVSKGKLIELSKLCPKFEDVAGDTRLWKDVYIKYKPCEQSKNGIFAFEELYSEPWPVKTIDMSCTEISLPVSLQMSQVVKVEKLNLSSIRANKVTMEAILAKYQCTELYLNYNRVDCGSHIMGIEPETFSKQTDLEVLSLVGISPRESKFNHLTLAPVLSNCKNLKTLDLSNTYFPYISDMLSFVKSLPASLEKLFLTNFRPRGSVFKELAERAPNLRELGLHYLDVCSPPLLKLQYLEILRLAILGKRFPLRGINHLYEYLIEFPALKTVYVCGKRPYRETELEDLRTMLDPHGIFIGSFLTPEKLPYPEDSNLWQVSGTSVPKEKN